MEIPKLIVIVSLFAIVITTGIRNFKTNKYKNKNICEYVLILLVIFLGAIVAYPYYGDMIPIALWSVLPGVIVVLIVEALRKRNK